MCDLVPVHLLVCVVVVGSIMHGKEGGTERASHPTVRWEPRCQESSRFPL